MYDLELMLEGMEKMDIVKTFAGNCEFDPTDDWFHIGIYGWSSFEKCDHKNCPIEIQELAHWIDCNHDDYIFEEFIADKTYEIERFLEDDEDEK